MFSILTIILSSSILLNSSNITSNLSVKNEENISQCAVISIEKDEVEVELSRNNARILMYTKMGEALLIRNALVEIDMVTNKILEDNEELEKNKLENMELHSGITELSNKLENLKNVQISLAEELEKINKKFEEFSCETVNLTRSDYYKVCKSTKKIYDTANCKIYRKTEEKDQI